MTNKKKAILAAVVYYLSQENQEQTLESAWLKFGKNINIMAKQKVYRRLK